MSNEIRDKVIDELAKTLSAYPWEILTRTEKEVWRTHIKDKILSNKHIAIVDREAKLPDPHDGFCARYGIDMLNDHWVKEVAPDTD